MRQSITEINSIKKTTIQNLIQMLFPFPFKLHIDSGKTYIRTIINMCILENSSDERA